MAAALLHGGGKLIEAESEYREALNALRQAGLGDTADAATILNSLGTLYIEEKRFTEARQALDRGLEIFESAKHAVPMDRIKLLNVRAILQAREGHWQDATRDLRQAVSLLDASAGACDPDLAAATMEDYATALRKIHPGHDARVIAARAAALRAQATSGVVVDVTELRSTDMKRIPILFLALPAAAGRCSSADTRVPAGPQPQMPSPRTSTRNLTQRRSDAERQVLKFVRFSLRLSVSASKS